MATKIEWAEETWNPISGCSPVSEGCKNCYAKRMAQRLAGRFGYPADDPFSVVPHWDKMDQPLKWKKPRRIFVCSMGDLFHEDVAFKWSHEVWDRMKATPQHIYMVLTKRPERMEETVGLIYRMESLGYAKGFWDHVWLGVTAENQKAWDQRVPILMDIPAAVRFVSVEPMLEEIDMRGWCPDWVICGGETGPGARPMKLEWARDLRDQCKKRGIPFFFKKVGGEIETPKDLMVRELPAGIER